MKHEPWELYSFENSLLTMIDHEMGLSFKEAFDPPRIPKKAKAGQIVDGDYHVRWVGDPPEQVYLEKDGLQEGQALLYYEVGSLKGEMFYHRGQLHGPATFWGEEGRVLSKCWYLSGHQEGKSWQYYSDGTLSSLQRFHKGLPHGNHEFYYPSGQLKTVMPYQKGKLHGTVYLYFPDGKLKQSISFNQGSRLDQATTLENLPKS